MDDDIGAAVNDWVSVVRRARLGATAHSVAVTLATYANPDGSRVYPGVARLAVQCEIGYRSVRRALRKLRTVGLIEVVRRGNRRRGLSDEYRLILAADLLERVDVPTPEQERKAIEAIHEADRADSARRYTRRVHGSPVPREPFITGQGAQLSRVTRDPPPSIKSTLPVNQPPYATGDLRTDVTVPDMIENPELIAAELDSPRDATRARTTRAERTIAEAQARVAARRAAHREAAS